MTVYQPNNLNRWTLPDSYASGYSPEYFVFLGQNCDSDALTRSNFISALERLGGESDTVVVVREWIAIHESDENALRIADEIAAELSDYPVIDEEHYCELEFNEACEHWERMHLRDRIGLCAKAGVSIFAARRDYLPDDPSGYILESLR